MALASPQISTSTQSAVVGTQKPEENACRPPLPGVGHANCAGGSLPLNAFGMDMNEAGNIWTLDLCRCILQ